MCDEGVGARIFGYPATGSKYSVMSRPNSCRNESVVKRAQPGLESELQGRSSHPPFARFLLVRGSARWVRVRPPDWLDFVDCSVTGLPARRQCLIVALTVTVALWLPASTGGGGGSRCRGRYGPPAVSLGALPAAGVLCRGKFFEISLRDIFCSLKNHFIN